MRYIKYSLFFLVFLSLNLTANAADFSFSQDSYSVGGQFIVVNVVIRANQPINAVGGKVVFNNQNLVLDSINDANSVVPLWVEHPKIGDDQQSITFSGIIPGGLSVNSHDGGNLFTIKFKIIKPGSNTFSFANLTTILNQPNSPEDQSNGTSLTLDTQPVTQNVSALVLDFYPPEEFQIFLFKDKEEFNNNYVIAFNTQDKGSGVDHYEVKERFLGLWGSWQTENSPYELSHQSLFSIIEVKAVDRVGRERLEKYIPWQLIAFYFALGLSLLFFLGYLLNKNHKFLKRV